MLRLSVLWLFLRTTEFCSEDAVGFYFHHTAFLVCLHSRGVFKEAFTDHVRLDPFGGAFLVGIVRGAFVICFKRLGCECLALLEFQPLTHRIFNYG